MKRARHALRAAAAVAVFLFARGASATGFTDIGQDLTPRDKVDVRLDGYFRMRGEAMYDFDLNRGLTPSGKPLFPVSLSDPTSKTLTYWDSRLRTDLSVYAPGGTMAVKARVDVLDNVPLGGSASGIPSTSVGYDGGPRTLRVKRAYGEVLTPIGLLAAGRMGNHWGLGMLANGGDCADCDSGDAADRLALLSPILGHVLALAYDFSATGLTVPRQDNQRYVNVEPAADVRTFTAALLRFKSADARMRRRRADRTTFEYGAYVSHRWQNKDIPALYLPAEQAVPVTSAQVMQRGYQATALDAWARLTLRALRVEAEAAYLLASVEQASLFPGALFNQPVTSHQFGAALESEVAVPDGGVGAGIDLGYASGDPAPGFGAFPVVGAPAPKPGDLDGSQANPPTKNTVDNFRFHPDYHIDRILFREIIGAVTDATYVRPHARVRLVRFGNGQIEASVFAVGSMANYASSTPGGQKPLGVEVDPTLAYANGDGFYLAFEYAVLFPLAGLDNPDQHLSAKPAQLARVRLAYVF